jgi:hypothetical protein
MVQVIPDKDDLVIGERLFTDGLVRQVFRDRCGAQYVVDDGERNDGTSLDSEEAAVNVLLTRNQLKPMISGSFPFVQQ